MSVKQASLLVSHELLASLLQLPAGVTIRHVLSPTAAFESHRLAVLIVEGDALPVEAVPEGTLLPAVEATATVCPDEHVAKWQIAFSVIEEGTTL